FRIYCAKLTRQIAAHHWQFNGRTGSPALILRSYACPIGMRGRLERWEQIDFRPERVVIEQPPLFHLRLETRDRPVVRSPLAENVADEANAVERSKRRRLPAVGIR